MGKNKRLIISAINIFEGGPLSILNDLVENLRSLQNIVIILLVHDKNLIKGSLPKNIFVVEYSQSRKSYFLRLYYEYVHFYFLSRKVSPTHWLSLHDSSPFVDCLNQFVYCHNPVVFRDLKLKDIYFSFSVSIQTLLYRFIYAINLNRNKKIIVQQHWFKSKFALLYKLDLDKIIVALPNYSLKNEYTNKIVKSSKYTFFYPSIPRLFKNFEVVCEAAKIVRERGYTDFEVRITLNGTENKYSNWVKKKYQSISNVIFLGKISRENVFKNYGACDTLIFASSLETWGLPLSEFKEFNKPILSANEPYAKETIGDYDNVSFFSTNNAEELSKLMISVMDNDLHKFDGNVYPYKDEEVVLGWEKLLEILLSY
ncbi:glycosyltransferase [Jiulongibacter sp. NS-SX5]|uniref:glycosyltransferase n=1 Tax=Jiulongibacter sp. NS-SX5 TaxID=3463854 RepID=UPI004059DE61